VTGVGFQVVLDAHSIPIQFWEAAGFLGIAAFVLYLTGVFATGRRLLRNPDLPRGSPEFVKALMVSYGVWLLSGFLQNPLADRYIYLPVGLLLGLSLAANARTPNIEPEDHAGLDEPDLVDLPSRGATEPVSVAS
jgi:hypothetical protein